MTAADIAAVILAAGRSSRLGRPKALLDIDGLPALTRLCQTYLDAGLKPVVAVVSDVSRGAVPDGAVAIDGDPDAEMIDSVARGLEAAGDVTGALVQPVDAPFTDSAMIERLVSGAADRFRVLTHTGQPGHPIYVPKAAFDLVRSRPAGGLRTLLDDRAESIEWPTPRILADLDAEEDVARWLD